MKYSIVIPTLWKSNRIYKLVDDLTKSAFVGEVIIIDNTREFNVHKDGLNVDKLRVFQPEKNLFVAASWNKGVALARFEEVALLGDDANFDPNVFGYLATIDGIVGQSSNNYLHHYPNNGNYFVEPLGEGRPWGWGCIITFNKKHWIDVPKQLRVWYNDDFINKKNPAPQYVLNGLKIDTEMSTTSDLPEFNSIKKEDEMYWNSIK